MHELVSYKHILVHPFMKQNYCELKSIITCLLIHIVDGRSQKSGKLYVLDLVDVWDRLETLEAIEADRAVVGYANRACLLVVVPLDHDLPLRPCETTQHISATRRPRSI